MSSCAALLDSKSNLQVAMRNKAQFADIVVGEGYRTESEPLFFHLKDLWGEQ